VGITIYFIAQYAVMNYVHKIKDVKPLWFANVANSILWWTFVKACWRAAGSTFGSAITFKTTLKGANAFLNKSIGDLWMPTCSLLALLSALGEAILSGFESGTMLHLRP
jgi:endoglucanase